MLTDDDEVLFDLGMALGHDQRHQALALRSWFKRIEYWLERMQQLDRANVALVEALDRIHDILNNDKYLEHPDKAIHQIINDAIKLHKMSTQ